MFRLEAHRVKRANIPRDEDKVLQLRVWNTGRNLLAVSMDMFLAGGGYVNGGLLCIIMELIWRRMHGGELCVDGLERTQRTDLRAALVVPPT